MLELKRLKMKNKLCKCGCGIESKTDYINHHYLKSKAIKMKRTYKKIIAVLTLSAIFIILFLLAINIK